MSEIEKREEGWRGEGGRGGGESWKAWVGSKEGVVQARRWCKAGWWLVVAGGGGGEGGLVVRAEGSLIRL